MKRIILFCGLFLSTTVTGNTQPSFRGVSEALPAPGAAVLRWERASGTQGDVTYRVYTKGQNGWRMDAPVAEIEGNEWVITDLTAGVPHEFLVRAHDNRGEDNNRKTVTVTPTSNQPREEWRGVWMTRFEWPGGSQDQIKERVSTAMKAFGSGNLNAVIFQVRGQGDVLYKQSEEPLSQLLKGDARTFDAVEFAIEHARKNGLEFHAWMNLSTIWQSGSKSLPPDTNHPFYKIADARNADTRLGLIHDKSRKPVQWGSNNYVWLTHGNPDVNAYLRRQVVQFAIKYGPDGFHWDDNTANPNGVSHDPVSVRRYEQRGNPMKVPDFGSWQRDQITRMLSNIYVQCQMVRPGLLFTASPFGIADRNRIPGYGRFSDSEKFGTDPEEWLNQGVVDALIPQVYWDLPDPEPNYGTLVRDWLEHNTSGRPIWPGSALGKYGDVQPLVPMQKRYVALGRALGADGFTFFSYSQVTTNEWATQGKEIFPVKAEVPIPAHRKVPHGHVGGYLKDSAGAPVTDGWIRVKGRDYIYLSSGDGFYGIPNLKPGEYTVQFLGTRNERIDKTVTVTNGKATRLDAQLPRQ